MSLRLLPVPASGTPDDAALLLDEPLRAICAATAQRYAHQGFNAPWIGYLAVRGEQVVGHGGFASAPVNGEVQIRFATLDEHQGQGVASALAQALVELAHGSDPRVELIAHSEPLAGASTAILTKLGFFLEADFEHPDQGEIWVWRLAPT
ncbi:MAG: GNAT family N-acetyltransferase [Pseudomonas sp.]|uniref:GNAT family N-acetyltransferase n=1 Tax=Pseudomonas sp. TaxID=306 RepID=UPI0033943BA5